MPKLETPPEEEKFDRYFKCKLEDARDAILIKTSE